MKNHFSSLDEAEKAFSKNQSHTKMQIYVIAHEKFLAWFQTRIAGLVGGRSSTALADPGFHLHI